MQSEMRLSAGLIFKQKTPLARGSLFSVISRSREPRCVLGGFADGVRFVDGFHIFGVGVAVVDDAAACLDVEFFVLEDRSP